MVQNLAFKSENRFVLQRLHEGVSKDLERVEKKRENLRLLEEQRLLSRQLEEDRHGRET